MDLHTQIQVFRDEYGQILCFLDVCEGALDRAASPDYQERRRGLQEMRDMEPYLVCIEEHCRSEERVMEEPFGLHVGSTDLQSLKVQHETLARWRNDFRGELELASPKRTDALIRAGRKLIAAQRSLISYEERLLEQIEDGHTPREDTTPEQDVGGV